MSKLINTFVKGKMNKSVDERLLPPGEYVDALNVRVGNTETTEIGSLENTKGNIQLTTLSFGDQSLSTAAICIGSLEDGSRENIYWFVHDPTNPSAASGIADLIVSYNVQDSSLTYHVTSSDDGSGVKTALNFSPTYLINGIDIIENQLFFTDNYNPPRAIDVNRAYGVITDYNFLNVIKAPPIFSPSIELINTQFQVDYLEDKMISFAYRWKYKENQYSALSPFSLIAFEPRGFRLNANNYTNSGMLNDYNAADVTFNTGDDEVIGIDLVFKFADDNFIRIAERINKVEEGLPNNVDHTITFDNSSTYSILPEAEILRLYDNVPRLAQAQTIMGNRVMYGNYLEGYNLEDSNGSDLNVDYTVEYSGEAVNFQPFPTSFLDAPVAILPSVAPIQKTAQIVNFDLTGVSFVAGSQVYFSITVEHTGFQVVTASSCPGTPAAPSSIGSGSFTVDITYTVPIYYPNVHAFVQSADFQAAIGTAANIQTPAFNCANGGSLTDVYNCNILTPQGSTSQWSLSNTGFTSYNNNDPLTVSSTSGSNIVSFRILAANFTWSGCTIPQMAEYFQITGAEGSAQSVDSNRSLHSDRNYEVAMEYLDDYGRSTTALVSPNNSVYVPCLASSFKNVLISRIPVSQRAPGWAKYYRFLVKPDRYLYQTIYANLWYNQAGTNNCWVQLEGENQKKVEVGQFLRVKQDINGGINNCVIVEVLDKTTQERNFLTGGSLVDPAITNEVEGVYMKIKPEGFDSTLTQTTVLTNGEKKLSSKKDTDNRINDGSGKEKALFYNYPVYSGTGATTSRWVVNEGDEVNILINVYRAPHKKCKDECGAKETVLNINYTSSSDYVNLKEFWEGEGLPAAWANSPDSSIDCVDDSGSGAAVYYSTMGTGIGDEIVVGSDSYYASYGTSQVQFFESASGGAENFLYMRVVGGNPYCSDDKKDNQLTVSVKVIQNPNNLTFETIPLDANADLYYEGSETYNLGPNGEHLGITANGDVDQNFNTATQAVINLNFYNCFTFGNGVESFRILDSLSQQYFLFGNRVNSVLAEEYKEIRRFSDVTYSGTFQTEANVNRLNEFNLGLANFKALEQSFGEIGVIDGRETDLLVLQEDKVSYVLLGKNLLSDSTGGGPVTSVPEVLGTQIARVEDYGISFNPESYVQWGSEKFFTDAKRGAVIRLTGQGKAEALDVISDLGMNSWFRDLFQDSFYTQKLGGYDAYMDEYILSSNDTLIPLNVECLECGNRKQISVANNSTLTYCVDYGAAVGTVDIDYVGVGAASNIDIAVTYNGVTTTFSNLSGTGTVTFNKTLPYVNKATIVITGNNPSAASIFSLNNRCVSSDTISVVSICITSEGDATQSIHNQYNYSSGGTFFATTSNAVVFATGTTFPIISQYDTTTGPQGQATIPITGSTVHLYSSVVQPDSFVFDPTEDNFGFLRSSTLYPNTPTGITNLVADAGYTVLTNNVDDAPQTYKSSFTMPAGSNGDYLYLVYDYRKSNSIDLCYSSLSAADACCNCTTCEEIKPFLGTGVALTKATLCPTSPPVAFPYYFTGSGTEPEIGDDVWVDAAGTSCLGVGWYKIGDATTGHVIQVSNVSQNPCVNRVLLKQLC